MFAQLESMITTLISDSRAFMLAVLGAAFAISALVLGLAGEGKKEAAKAKIVWIIIAAFLIVLCQVIIKEVVTRVSWAG